MWISQGDRSTRYYHNKTMIRRRRNRIRCLKNDEGEWIDDERKISDMFQKFYHELFSDDIILRDWQLTKQKLGQ